MRVLVVHVPGLSLVASSNRREHGAKRGGRNRRQKEALSWHLLAAGKAPSLPAKVTVVRWGKGRMDADNCGISAKECRDEVARYLGLPLTARGVPDDSDPRVRWRVFGALGPPGVTVAIEPWPEGSADDGLERLEVCAERRKGALAEAYPDCDYLRAGGK